jgi:hypothetical protein
MASKRALLVGIDHYPDPRNNLNSCVADTQRFRGLLQNYYGFQPQDITLLHNGEATLANVRIHLSQLFTGVSTGDQVVFFQSSHGYRYVKGSTFVEVLCEHDEFLEDTELVQLSQQVPSGTFTCVLDACHSAGLEKLFFAPDGLHAARAKVWQPPPEQAAADLARLTQATSFKSFARAATSDSGAVAKQFSAEAFGTNAAPQAKAGEGQPELNGVLFAACLADQTAAAGSPPTDGLSAFTWALGRELEVGGATIAANALRDRVDQRLQALNMRQTPAIEAPMAHGGWLTETLISYGGATGTVSTPAPQTAPTPTTTSDGGEFDSFLQGLGIGVKGVDMTADKGQEGAAKPRAKKAAQKRAAAEGSVSKSPKESDVSVTTTSQASAGTSAAGPGVNQKGWGDLFGDIIPDIVGPIAQGFGIDPRVAGQAASQVMSIFGIGGAGKAFTAAVPKEQAVSQLQQIVAPCLGNPTEVKALNAWLKAAIEPVQAHQGGKAFQPDFSKSWLSDAWDTVTDTVSDVASSVDWGKVGQIGLQALPYVIAAI